MTPEFEFEEETYSDGAPNLVPGAAFIKSIASADSTSSSTLRIGGTDIRVTQFMDYPNPNDPQGGHYLIVNFANATLANANNQEIYTGFVSVRINAAITPASLSIISRLLNPFKGYFVMIVTGSYILPGSYAEVNADTVPWTNIQPSP